MNDYTIGIIGGMGSFATVDFFKRLVEAFPAEKEWERPHIIVDNFCTMPSRVRAILYNEKRKELVNDLSKSTINMLRGGVQRIVLACNTSHVFLPEIEKTIPECKGKFLHIIETLAKDMKSQNVNEAYLLASEGTIQTGIYAEYMEKVGIKLISPSEEHYFLLRSWIEAVKQNLYTDDVLLSFKDFIDKCTSSSLILGCTELPVLYQKALLSGWKPKIKILDPLESVIRLLKEEYYTIQEKEN